MAWGLPPFYLMSVCFSTLFVIKYQVWDFRLIADMERYEVIRGRAMRAKRGNLQ